MTDSFIYQTAQDYDMDVEIVRDIVNRYPDTFYAELESYIKNRS